MNDKIRIDALIPPEYENFTAEAVVEGECVLIVSYESGFSSLDVTLLPRRDGQPRLIKYDLLVEALQMSKARLEKLEQG
jgi:hypothetical protein